MNFKEYEEKAITTKCYADEVAIPYVVLGLCGEMGEFFEKLKEEAELRLTLKEVGDILWYIAAIRIELNLTPIEWPAPKKVTDADPLMLISAMGAVAEQVKKYLRDDWKSDQSVELSETRKTVIHENLQKVLQCLTSLCKEEFDTDIESIAADNIEKLADRANRNQIHGQGDER